MTIRPLASIHTLTIAELNVIDCIVTSKVIIVESQVIKTDTIGELQFVSDIPLILRIEAQLIEGNLSIRIALAIETVCNGERLRTGLVQEVLNAVVAIVTRTITHIGIICHLVLEVETSGNLVGGEIEGEVVSDAGNLVLHTVVIGEKLVTQRHIGFHDLITIGVLTGHNVDEGELAGIRATHILDIGIGEEQLVGNLLSETAVEVSRD